MRSKRNIVELQQAFVLHSRPFRDQSILVNLLTENNGHVSAVVYVGSSKKSNKKGLLQPFSCLNVDIQGRNDLKNLSYVELAQKSISLAGNHLFSGFYINELMVRLLPENIALEQLFSLYKQSLSELENKSDIEPILRKFEMCLLQELGLSLDFSEINEATATESLYCYLPEQGFVLAEFANNSPTYNGQHLIDIGYGKLLNRDVLLTSKRLMRQVLKSYLGNAPLHSRKLFRSNN